MASWLRAFASKEDDAGALGRHTALLASLVLLLVALPLAQISVSRGAGFPFLLAPVLVAAVFVNGRRRAPFVFAATLGASAIGGLFAADLFSADGLRIASQLLGLALLAVTTLVLLGDLVRGDHVSLDTVVGGICVYLLVGLCFAMAFIVMVEIAPGALSAGGDAIGRDEAHPSEYATQLLYFSFVTLTTLGYGDISPEADFAQMLAVAEALIGQLYLTIFVARLVGLYVAGARRPSTRSGPDPSD